MAHPQRRMAVLNELSVVQSGIHDFMAACSMTCSIISSISLEGLVHETPAILFGQTGFNHVSETGNQAHEYAGALDLTLARADRVPYAAFLYWFLQLNCISMGRIDWFGRVQLRMQIGLTGGGGPRAS